MKEKKNWQIWNLEKVTFFGEMRNPIPIEFFWQILFFVSKFDIWPKMIKIDEVTQFWKIRW